MKVTMLLADAAQAINGKLYILGGGWSVTGPGPNVSAIALKIEVPWDEANRRHTLLLELLDADGHKAMLPVAEGELRAMEIKGDFEVGRPPGVTPGTPLDAALAINLNPVPLAAGRRYVWRLSINGRSDDEWQVAFSTRPASQS